MTPFLHNAIDTMLARADAEGGCRECGFTWTLGVDEAVAHIRSAPQRYRSHLADRDGSARPAPDVWSPSAYVWHLADAFRVWAERLHAIAADGQARLAGFDPDELAAVRAYDAQPQSAGLWTLSRAVGDLDAALEEVDAATTFSHPEWGPGDVGDVLRWLAHEAVHHELDVSRGLAG